MTISADMRPRRESRATVRRPAKTGSHTLAILTSILLVAPVLADEPNGGDKIVTSQPAEKVSLAERQEIVRDRINRLEDRMFQLSQALRKSEPDKSERLLEGLGRLRGAQVREKMGQIVERLKSNRLSDATDDQQAVMAELQSLLKQLMEDPDHIGERKSEIERLEAIRKSLEALVQEQERELREAQRARAAQLRAEALEAAADKVKEILKEQRDASNVAEESENRATTQAELRGRTETVAKDVRAVADAESQESPEANSPESGAAEAAEALDQAGRDMQSAEESLRGGEPDAKEHQEKAAASLENALKNLEEQAKSIRKKLELEKQAEEQRETAEKTRALGDDMKGGESKSGQKGEGTGEKSGQEPQSDEGEESGQTPGQKSVQDAVPYQRDAADELKKEKTDKAIEKQEKAVENLKKAQEELEDRLDQLRKEQQEELLAALESRFRAMLARQVECNKATNRLAEIGPANWKRSDQLELAELSQRQRWVGDQADEALFLLTEEGSTVILPTLIQQIRDDGREVADRLAAADAGESVRVTQADLEAILRDIIGAIERKQEEMESEEDSGGESGDSNPPLLPGSAELKLLRACQLRVNKMTQQLQTDRTNPDASAEEIGKRLKKLSERQADVAEMAKNMHEALRQAQ